MQKTARQTKPCARRPGYLLGIAMLIGLMSAAWAADGDGQDLMSRMAGSGGVFDFTKLDTQGQPLGNQDAIYTITSWSCVRDNVTGLMWEVKTIDGGLRDQSNTYTWYNPDADENGGAPGRKDGGECNGSRCDTQGYVQAVNNRGLCGHTDWQMPTRAQLRTIVDYEASLPSIQTDYFPNTVARSFWSGEPNLTYPNYAWHTDFKFGLASYYYLKSGAKSVRLVRGVEEE